MQIAAMNPQYVSQDEVPAAVLEKEKGDPHRAGQAVGQARGGHPQDRRRPDREVGEGDLPARSAVGQGPDKKDIRIAAHRAHRQDRREHPRPPLRPLRGGRGPGEEGGRLRRRGQEAGRPGLEDRDPDSMAKPKGKSGAKTVAKAAVTPDVADTAQRRRVRRARPAQPHGARAGREVPPHPAQAVGRGPDGTEQVRHRPADAGRDRRRADRRARPGRRDRAGHRRRQHLPRRGRLARAWTARTPTTWACWPR